MSADEKQSSHNDTLQGVWLLKSRTDTDPNGQCRIDPILGADPLGMVCFAGGRFSAQFMKRDRSGTLEAPLATQGTNNSSAVNGYDAYFGTYELDAAKGTITVHLEGALSPSNIGKSFTREVHVKNDELTIRLGTSAADGTPLTRTLVFSRLG